jgi:AcrR family transcriptional regulator
MSPALPQLQPTRRPRGRPPTPGLRARILRAAETIFARHDYHEVQMDDVVEACGVGKGTIYRHFPSKQDLYFAVMFEGIEQLRVELEAAVGKDEPAALKIRRIVHRTLAYFWDRRFFFSLIHRNEHKPDAQARKWLRHRQMLSQLIQETLQAALAAGHLRSIDTRIATEMLLGMMRGVNRYRTENDHLEDLVTAVVDVFMSGVGTPGGRRIVGGSPSTKRGRSGSG